MTINWRTVTLMLVDLALLMHLIAAFYHAKHRKQTDVNAGPLSLIVSDRGTRPRRSLAHLFAPAAAACQTDFSPEAGAYVLGTNPLGRFFPRYIYFRDGSACGLRLAIVIAEEGTLTMTVLKGSVRFDGLVYHEDKHRILTIRRGESFWLGQSEIKVR